MTDTPPEIEDQGHHYVGGMAVPVTSFDYTQFDVEPDLVRREQRLARSEHRMREFIRGLLDYLRGGADSDAGYRLRVLVLTWHFDGRHAGELGASFARQHGMKKQLFQREVARFRRMFGHVDRRYYSRGASIAARLREQAKREGRSK